MNAVQRTLRRCIDSGPMERFGARGLIRGALLVTGSTHLAYVLGLLGNILIARALGPADYGRYAYLVWLSGLLVLFINNGLNSSAIRFISESVGRSDELAAGRLLRWFMLRHWLSAAVVSAGFLLLLPWLRPEGWQHDLAVFAGIALAAALARSTYLLLISLAKGHGHFALEWGTITTMSLLSLAGVSAAFVWRAPLAVYLGLFLAVSLLHPLLATWALRRAGFHARSGELPPTLLARLRPHLYWTLLLTCSAALSGKALETWLLNRLWSAESVAYFNIAAALTRGGVEMLSSGFSTVLMPSMAHAFAAEGLPRVQRITADAVRLLQLLGFALAGVGFFWARPVILWMYGTQYLPAVPALQVMVVVGGLGLTQGAFGALLSTTDHQGLRALVACLSLLISLVCAVSFVPAFGLDGALASNAIATLAVLAVTAVLVRRKLGIHLPWRDFGRLALATTVGAVAGSACVGVWPTVAGWFLAGVAFAAVYIPATVALGFWRAQDRALLSRLPLPAGLRRRLAASAAR